TRRRARRTPGGVPAQPSTAASGTAAPSAAAAPSATAAPSAPADSPSTGTRAEPGPGFLRAEAPGTGGAKVLAKPPVRRLARDLGVELSQVPPGEDGIVTREAVLAAAGQQRADQQARDRATDGTGGGPAAAGRAPADQPGDVRIPVKGVRKATAEAMVASAFTAPHVTEWVQVDVTESVRLLERLKADRSVRDVRLSPFTLVARAMCLAVRRHPGVNVSWDEPAREIVVHGRVGLGFAAATERGLVVPVVPDAASLDLPELARQVADLVDTARAGRLQPAQQAGGTLTVTNVGVFGVDGGTPILPPGTGLILACGQVRRMPWVVGTGDAEQVVPRDVMTLAVSFDHRMIDGELGSRYLADVARLLEDPGYGLAWA
ncbi:dihydrolipoamide acetyltransferase family protein, partial [Aquipuribacter hungaricus]